MYSYALECWLYPDAAACDVQKKMLGMQSVHNTAMLLLLRATAMRTTQHTESWARD